VDERRRDTLAAFFHSAGCETNDRPLRKSLRGIDFHEDPEGFDA
jgi:hypothetical protein